MRGQLITSDHKTYDLPGLLAWKLTYTGGVPCDCFTVTFPYDSAMAQPLHLAAGFTALQAGEVLLRGIVDEYFVELGSGGLTATVAGRGYAARLLDNESRPVTYEAATLAEILQGHVTPYGIACAQAANVSATSVYTVAAGCSQWKALADFCQVYGGFVPRFTRRGQLIAAPETDDGRRLTVRDGDAICDCTLREDHYGVLTEVLVIDKTRNAAYTVENADMRRRGGQCRRVVYTPGQSTWAAMRYTGEYQIARSREEEKQVMLTLPGSFVAFPGDRVRLELNQMGLTGDFRVAEAENLCSATGGCTARLTLKECG